jgi:hypothetical protein
VTDPGWHPPGEGYSADAPGPYLGPPPTTPPEAVPPHPYANANPYANPNPYGNPNPYAPYGYPGAYGYPGMQPGQRRPASLTAAAVLGYVNAGLLVIAGLLLFTGASLVNSVDESADGLDLESFSTELTFDGFVNLLAAGLLIAGGMIMTARRPNGRALYGAGAGIVGIETIYWLGRWGSRVDDVSGILVYALIFAALAIVGVGLAWSRDGTTWFNERTAAPSWR